MSILSRLFHKKPEIVRVVESTEPMQIVARGEVERVMGCFKAGVGWNGLVSLSAIQKYGGSRVAVDWLVANGFLNAEADNFYRLRLGYFDCGACKHFRAGGRHEWSKCLWLKKSFGNIVPNGRSCMGFCHAGLEEALRNVS